MNHSIRTITLLLASLVVVALPMSAAAEQDACALLEESELARILDVDQTAIDVTAGDRALYGSGTDRDCLWTWNQAQVDSVLRIRITPSTVEAIGAALAQLESTGETVDGAAVAYRRVRLQDGRLAAVSSVYGGAFDRERTLVFGLRSERISMILRHRQVGPGALQQDPDPSIMLAIAGAIDP